MIKANELRLGNKVHFQSITGEKSVATIKLIGNPDVLPLSSGAVIIESNFKEEYCSYELIFPIKLTDEIIEKCNFKYSRPNFQSSSLRNSSSIYEPIYTYVNQPIGVHLESLHQLQNLYFALTGEELEVNL